MGFGVHSKISTSDVPDIPLPLKQITGEESSTIWSDPVQNDILYYLT